MLASASLDNFIRLWDIRTGKCLFKLEKPSIASGKFRFDLFDGLIDEIDHLGFVSVSFSPGGDRLVSVAKDSTIYVWDLKKRECITKIFCCDIHESYCELLSEFRILKRSFEKGIHEILFLVKDLEQVYICRNCVVDIR